jgi:hypothetical protein
VSTQQSQQPESLVTIHNLEHSRPMTRRIKACLTLAGAAAAGVLALTATSPAAQADTVDVPVFPSGSGETIDPQSLGIAPFFTAEAYEQQGTYTDLLGNQFDTAVDNQPFEVNNYAFPGINPSLAVSDVFTRGEASDSGALNGSVEPTTFSVAEEANLGFNIYEDTPFDATGATETTQNINDVLVYDPTLASPVTDPSAIEFGIQYLDLPDAATPVDAINFLGSGGEILFSLPVTGDLFASLF